MLKFPKNGKCVFRKNAKIFKKWKMFLEIVYAKHSKKSVRFFSTASTHRDTSIARVFHAFGPPVTPYPLIEPWETAYFVRISVY